MKIEIKGETEVKGEVAEALTRMLQASRMRQMPLSEIPGIGGKTAEKLTEAGLESLADLLDKSAEELSTIPGIGAATAEKILEAARTAEDEIRSPRSAEADEESEEVDEESEEESAISDQEVSAEEVSGEEQAEPSEPAEETIVQE